MGRSGHNALASPAHLLEFGHEIFFCVEPACGVDDYIIDASGLGSLKGIEDNCARVRTRFLTDHIHLRALRPDLELFDSCRAKRICGAEKNLAPFT
jgi:hypothetical protein